MPITRWGDDRSVTKKILGAVLVLAFLVAASAPALAVPVFARRYQTACTTCHVMEPKLNAFGIAFRNNGYRIPNGEDQLVHTPDTPLGAPAWKRLWPRAVWPGSIPGFPPVAFRVISDATIQPANAINLNLNFPSGVNFYVAGSEGAGISFFGNVFVSGAAGTVAVDRAYAQFRLTPDTPGQNLLVLKVGRIETRAEPFSQTFRRTTGLAFNVADFRSVPGGFGLRDHDAGVEAWGAVTGPNDRGGLEYAVGFTQGTAGRAENNNFKDYYGAVSYKFSGLGVVGPRSASAEGGALATERSVTLGLFSYTGRSQPTVAGVTEDRFTRTGVKADLWFGKLNLFGALARGTDDLRGTSPRTVTARAAMLEADFMLLPWVMPAVRLEKTTYSDRQDVVALVSSLSLLVRANVRVLTEGRFYNGARSVTGARINPNDGVVRLEFLF